MTFALIPLIVFATASTAFARLGDTRDQAEAKYGLEKREGVEKFRSSLLEGAKEITFEFEGWRIRCALLLATDGNQYVVREEYTKIWNSAVMKAGGTPTIRDFECEAVLEGERGNLAWRRKLIAAAGNNVSSTIANQLALGTGLAGRIWIRDDGAVAQWTLGGGSIILDLPQALKYDAELKASKEQKARAAVPKF